MIAFPLTKQAVLLAHLRLFQHKDRLEEGTYFAHFSIADRYQGLHELNYDGTEVFCGRILFAQHLHSLT